MGQRGKNIIDMEKLIIAAGILSIITAVIVVIYTRYKQKKIMEGLGEMLEQAVTGDFTVNSYDESRRSALEKEKIKELIADISHQTKTPLANILLYTELLREEELNDEACESVNKLYNQVEKLQFLISALVKISRLETGIIAINPETGNLKDMVETAIDGYRDRIAAKGIRLKENLTDVATVFDVKWSSEAVSNILDNAVKYTEAGTITVIIHDYEMFGCVEIVDTGIGISEEEHAKVFSRFYRGIRVSQKEGVGIGLYLTREILLKQGGYMKLKSVPDRGSSFGLYFPKMR